MKPSPGFVAGLLAVAIVFVVLATTANDVLTLQALKDRHATLVGLFQEYPGRSFAVYAVGLITLVSFSIPGTLLFMLFAGSAFKLSIAIPLIVLCRSIGGVVAFLIGRHVARDWLRDRFAGTIEAIDRGVEREGWLYLAMLRLAPALPDSVINPGMGLTAMSLRTFFWVSALGMVPYVVMYAIAGQQFMLLASPGEAVSVVWLVVLTGLALLLFALKRLSDRLAVAPQRETGPP
jgi:uncharacterized membrane protein YdjX (TVP38/TMEM64 family)